MDTFSVRSRSVPDRYYQVSIDGDETDCQCPAATYGNRNCAHVQIARHLMEEERRIMSANNSSVPERLKAPFPAKDIDWRAGPTNADKTKALALAYINARAVQDRLDAVVGIDGWWQTYRTGPQGGVVCALTVVIDGKPITKEDGAENTEFEPVKGGLSDAFKRAAVQFGIGRYLYHLDGQWVVSEKRGNTVILKETPRLPAWALPEGEQQAPSHENSNPNGVNPERLSKALGGVEDKPTAIAQVVGVAPGDLKTHTAVKHAVEAWGLSQGLTDGAQIEEALLELIEEKIRA